MHVPRGLAFRNKITLNYILIRKMILKINKEFKLIVYVNTVKPVWLGIGSHSGIIDSETTHISLY
jgi:hypothetical protein